jgi:hypothetical protein
LFDNGYPGSPVHAQCAKEYELNERELKAKCTWSYTESQNNFSWGFGSVQRLAKDYTLINYGRSDGVKTILNVIGPDGSTVFELSSDDSLRSYRAYYYRELGWTPVRPKIKCVRSGKVKVLDIGENQEGYLWSTGETTRSIRPRESGIYWAGFKQKNGGFLISESYYYKN